MVHISKETPDQINRRLEMVLKQATCLFYPQTFAFDEFPLSHFPAGILPHAVALVRDDQCWSQLVPSSDANKELFAVWRFHFPEDMDNSGFVGWLANHFKAALGSGVFVICGSNSGHGGIYDYWGCPASLRDAAFELLTGMGVKPVEKP